MSGAVTSVFAVASIALARSAADVAASTRRTEHDEVQQRAALAGGNA